MSIVKKHIEFYVDDFVALNMLQNKWLLAETAFLSRDGSPTTQPTVEPLGSRGFPEFRWYHRYWDMDFLY